MIASRLSASKPTMLLFTHFVIVACLSATTTGVLECMVGIQREYVAMEYGFDYCITSTELTSRRSLYHGGVGKPPISYTGCYSHAKKDASIHCICYTNGCNYDSNPKKFVNPRAL
ncbi:Protein CBG27405 [Caenorhabditis briggsae]|uniref:Protein CBG27405 n=1 Tax=Caenorhabditis briggsae TaxID=6238 RepID=B6IJY2_CAEBR|nr:Protein CBG27405 [Caenorhabditis briggsae]CAS00212.1 Protein CBG27405 [Caenorhabditis briggsae]